MVRASTCCWRVSGREEFSTSSCVTCSTLVKREGNGYSIEFFNSYFNWLNSFLLKETVIQNIWFEWRDKFSTNSCVTCSTLGKRGRSSYTVGLNSFLLKETASYTKYIYLNTDIYKYNSKTVQTLASLAAPWWRNRQFYGCVEWIDIESHVKV